MARKKIEDEEDDHERWLVSYADFMTLLFAFFVVMYAVSSVNEGKYRILSNALGSAFGSSHATPIGLPPINIQPQLPLQPLVLHGPKARAPDAMRREKDHMTAMARSLLDALAPLVQQGKVRITQSTRGITVEINASVLFAPGSAVLANESRQALTAVAGVLRNDQHPIQVEGHTDNTPINNAQFPSNWELSTVRASSVVRLFIENGVKKERLSAVGYGDTRPLAPNDSIQDRQRNRRVEVVIMAATPDTVTEVPVYPSSNTAAPASGHKIEN